MDSDKSVQLNIRLAKELRDAGTAALQSRGINPSTYIRALWKKAALRGQDLDEVIQIVMPQKEAKYEKAAGQEADVLSQGQNLFKEALKEAGINVEKYKKLISVHMRNCWMRCVMRNLQREAYFHE